MNREQQIKAAAYALEAFGEVMGVQPTSQDLMVALFHLCKLEGGRCGRLVSVSVEQFNSETRAESQSAEAK